MLKTPTNICNKVCELYKYGVNRIEIAKQVGLSVNTVDKITLDNNLRNKRNIPSHFDESLFETIDNQDKAYWLGFLMGDGSVTTTSLSLELSNKDIDHLYKFKDFMKTNRNIKLTSKNCSKISINSKLLVQQLFNFGIIRQKTYSKIVTPNIDNQLKSHFYRGLFDADGWFTLHKDNSRIFPEFGFSSYYPEILNEIYTFMFGSSRNYGSIRERVRQNQKVCQWISGSKYAFKLFGDLFYKDASSFLNRKKALYDSYLQLI